MRALVVYESMFGNTERIAKAIVEGLPAGVTAEAVDVSRAPDVINALDFLVVGGPTHAFGMSRPSTRKSAGEQGFQARETHELGVREWLEKVRIDGKGLFGAAFDTRANKPRLPGTAAPKIARKLRRLGVQMIASPEHFYVSGMQGPLLDDEIDRARNWATTLATKLPLAPHGVR